MMEAVQYVEVSSITSQNVPPGMELNNWLEKWWKMFPEQSQCRTHLVVQVPEYEARQVEGKGGEVQSPSRGVPKLPQGQQGLQYAADHHSAVHGLEDDRVGHSKVDHSEGEGIPSKEESSY